MKGSPALPGPREQRDLILRAQGQGHDAHLALRDLVQTVGAPIVGSQLKRLREFHSRNAGVSAQMLDRLKKAVIENRYSSAMRLWSVVSSQLLTPCCSFR